MSLVSLTMSLMVTLVVTLVALTVMRAAGNKFGKFEPVGNSDRFKLKEIERFQGKYLFIILILTDALYADDWLLQFPKALLNFIEYYNCYRPHGALNYMSPKNYLEKYYSEM